MKKDDWFYKAVACAASEGVVNGVGDGKFNPDGDVTREQIAASLYCYANYKGIDTAIQANLSTFPVRANVSSWAEDALKWAVGERMISGVSDNGVVSLNPGNGGTRAIVATNMIRFIQNVVES